MCGNPLLQKGSKAGVDIDRWLIESHGDGRGEWVEPRKKYQSSRYNHFEEDVEE